MRTHRLGTAAAALALATLLGCSWNDDVAQPVAAPGANAVPDFGLLDVNPTSPTAGQVVSPRDYLGSVSAWYFGHST